MTTLPNIKISREELVWYYERNTTLMGAEGKIFEGESKKVVRKIFHPPLSKEKMIKKNTIKKWRTNIKS